MEIEDPASDSRAYRPTARLREQPASDIYWWILGVGRATVYRYIGQGKLDAIRVGDRSVRVARDDLAEFIVASNRNDAA